LTPEGHLTELKEKILPISNEKAAHNLLRYRADFTQAPQTTTEHNRNQRGTLSPGVPGKELFLSAAERSYLSFLMDPPLFINITARKSER
jgi:hypothetical protein